MSDYAYDRDYLDDCEYTPPPLQGLAVPGEGERVAACWARRLHMTLRSIYYAVDEMKTRGGGWAMSEPKVISDVASWLTERVAEAKAKGHEHILLVLGRRSGYSPKNWDRARVVGGRPSLWGRCVGPGYRIGLWMFDVLVSDAESWLAGNVDV